MNSQKYTHWFLFPSGEHGNLFYAFIALFGAVLGSSVLLFAVSALVLGLSFIGYELTGLLDAMYPLVYTVISVILFLYMWFHQRRRVIREMKAKVAMSEVDGGTTRNG